MVNLKQKNQTGVICGTDYAIQKLLLYRAVSVQLIFLYRTKKPGIQNPIHFTDDNQEIAGFENELFESIEQI